MTTRSFAPGWVYFLLGVIAALIAPYDHLWIVVCVGTFGMMVLKA